MIEEGRTGWHLESHTNLRQTQGGCITFNNMSLSRERNREIAVWAAFGRAKRETKAGFCLLVQVDFQSSPRREKASGGR